MRAASVRRIAAAQIVADLPGGALGGLERDVAGEAFGDHHVDRALADVVAFDEADDIRDRAGPLAQDPAGFAHLLVALHLLDTDIEKPDGRALEAEQHARHGAAHDGEIDEMLGIGADRGADVEHDQFAAQRRPQRRDRRPLDARQRLEVEFAPSPSARRYCRPKRPRRLRPS